MDKFRVYSLKMKNNLHLMKIISNIDLSGKNSPQLTLSTEELSTVHCHLKITLISFHLLKKKC